jgi:3-phenylpropionate/cinnamic acid dioxygenase small subunit
MTYPASGGQDATFNPDRAGVIAHDHQERPVGAYLVGYSLRLRSSELMDPGTLRPTIEAFLYHEARLLDEQRFDEWLDLFTDDVRYWLPAPETVQGQAELTEPGDQLNFGYIDDDKHMLDIRVRRLATGMAHVEVPSSDTLHLISNVEVESGPSPDEVWVHSGFIVRQVRRGRSESFFTGRRTDRLRAVDGAWKIAERRIRLAESLLPRTLSVFL